jgi:hypothetical protein
MGGAGIGAAWMARESHKSRKPLPLPNSLTCASQPASSGDYPVLMKDFTPFLGVKPFAIMDGDAGGTRGVARAGLEGQKGPIRRECT